MEFLMIDFPDRLFIGSQRSKPADQTDLIQKIIRRQDLRALCHLQHPPLITDTVKRRSAIGIAGRQSFRHAVSFPLHEQTVKRRTGFEAEFPAAVRQAFLTDFLRDPVEFKCRKERHQFAP